MSLIVAVKDPKTKSVYLGCDSIVSKGNKVSYSTNAAWSKIWTEDLDEEEDRVFVMGGAGYLRDIQLVQYNHLDPLTICKMRKEGLSAEQVALDFSETIFQILANYNRTAIDPNGNPIRQIEDQFLLAFDEEVYAIGGDFSIEDTDDYLAIGSGEEVASGVLEITKDLDPIERITLAIETTAKIVPSVGGDICITCTSKEGKKKICEVIDETKEEK